MNLISHYISGAEQKSHATRSAPVYDPALGKESGRVALADAQDIQEAINSAKNAYPAWRDTSLAKRQQLTNLSSFPGRIGFRKSVLWAPSKNSGPGALYTFNFIEPE